MSSPGYFNTEDQQAMMDLQRKQAFAQALMRQGGEDPGNQAYGGLRNAGNSILGAFLTGKYADKEKTLSGEIANKKAKSLAAILNPQEEIAPVTSTPQITAPGQLEERQAAGAYSQPLMRTPSTAEALANSGDPELMAQFAPTLIQDRLTRDREGETYARNRADKAMFTLSPDDAAKAGYRPGSVIQRDAFGGFHTGQASDLKSQGAVQQGFDIAANTPLTQAQIAANKRADAQLSETRRHNQVDENAKLHPFGVGGSAGTGDELLKSLPPGIASQVKAIATYRQAPPASRSAQSMALMNAVNQYSPTYDQTAYPAKSKARNDFATGKNGNNVRSLNVAVQHLEQLGQLSSALGNGDVQGVNRIGQFFAQQTGSAAPTNFDATKQLVADEIVKAVVGSGGGVHDREEAAKTISRANSPQQLAGVIQQYQGLLGGQLRGLRDQYKKTTGLDDFEEYLDPLTRQKLEGHGAAPAGGSAPSRFKIEQVH